MTTDPKVALFRVREISGQLAGNYPNTAEALNYLADLVEGLLSLHAPAKEPSPILESTAEAKGRKAERAAVVAWLRKEKLYSVAEYIATGQHLETPEKKE